MTTAKKSNWAAAFNTGQTTPTHVEGAPETPTIPVAPTATTSRTTKYNVTRPIKKADTYRLPLDAHALIRAELASAAENGDRLTKDDVVTKALRTVYGKKHKATTLEAFVAEIADGMKK